MAYDLLRATDHEPEFTDPAAARTHRKQRLALAYRVFGAKHWGDQGDGHISARDPERLDHFWLARLGAPFGAVTVADLVLVAPDGEVVEGSGDINMSAYYIHAPIHEARPEILAAAHTHTQYGTPWSANRELLRPITQEACAFFEDHALFDDEELTIQSIDGGKRIAGALGGHKAVILANHGLLTVGGSVDEAAGWFAMMERVAEAHCKAPSALPISAEMARRMGARLGSPESAWFIFQWLLRTHIEDPAIVS
jgi:ribulose-5-phosphate 4-epimerase/fuculose-1-phosphate aldolase